MDDNPALSQFIFAKPTEYLPLFDEAAIWAQVLSYCSSSKLCIIMVHRLVIGIINCSLALCRKLFWLILNNVKTQALRTTYMFVLISVVLLLNALVGFLIPFMLLGFIFVVFKIYAQIVETFYYVLSV